MVSRIAGSQKQRIARVSWYGLSVLCELKVDNHCDDLNTVAFCTIPCTSNYVRTFSYRRENKRTIDFIHIYMIQLQVWINLKPPQLLAPTPPS